MYLVILSTNPPTEGLDMVPKASVSCLDRHAMTLIDCVLAHTRKHGLFHEKAFLDRSHGTSWTVSYT
jgi:hypothetical protein